MKPYKTYINWSTGKDSALALYYLKLDNSYSIEQLVTTVNSSYNRVTMHGLRIDFIERQATSIGVPFSTIKLPEQPSMDDYNQLMITATSNLKEQGFTHSAFGDILLEDLKLYREKQLGSQGINTVFPLWKRNTKDLMQEFLDLGFKAVIVCANANYFSEDFVGRIIDEDLIANLPDTVDPCGENGEFHTFCFDGPIFKTPVNFEIGEKTYREYPSPDSAGTLSGFWFCDLLPMA
ncbi:diphthine--ammonia ligase [Bizionia argentinensis JUB59]|uniref:Diphthine--ammonia ligase n=1 Tax=Bizionia argentinensis JUB59 TaxID=1046627 RepID=G2EC18_9FLAO|nr:diphthine--ammonia ligase [Bizionia argentinensis]EGV43953.1 diphthine--ammonia ligase [Bizionia argentinensis JUB59]